MPIISKSESPSFLEPSGSVQACHRDCKIAEAVLREKADVMERTFFYKTVDASVYDKIKIIVPAVET